MTDVQNGQAAVYVSWVTFNNAIGGLAQGIPNKVDKSAFPGLSGGVQAQLMAGLKFLGLIDNDGTPQPSLAELAVTDEDVRKKQLGIILRERYAAIFAVGIEKMTPAQLEEVMSGSYSVGGDTREKAVRFFLSAAQYAGITVSRFLQPRAGATGGSIAPRRRRSSRNKPGSDLDGDQSDPPGAGGLATSGPSRTISLRSGGTLVLSASVDLFTLDREDREFVFKLIDQLTDYAKEPE